MIEWANLNEFKFTDTLTRIAKMRMAMRIDPNSVQVGPSSTSRAYQRCSVQPTQNEGQLSSLSWQIRSGLTHKSKVATWVPGFLLLWTSSERTLSYSRHNAFSLGDEQGDEDFSRLGDTLAVADGEHT